MDEKTNSRYALNYILDKRRQVIAMVGALVVFALIIYSDFLAYNNYRKELILTEQEQLLTMAETVGKSLVSYVKQELDNLDLYFSTPSSLESLEADAIRLLQEKDGLYNSLTCYDQNRSVLFGRGTMVLDPSSIPFQEDTVIFGKRIGESGWYEMFISCQCIVNGVPYTIVYAMDLNTLYTQIVQPVQIGEGGYSIVKDISLAIIMHHASSQIGMDAIYDRRERYPDLDLTDLFRWIHLQETQEEGYDVINSYKWDDPDLTPQKRIVAYTTIHLPGEDWIVNSTLPFEELNEPLIQMMFRLIALSSVFLVILIILVYVTTRSILRSENQKREIVYLKEINQGMELLRHKEEEIQHYQRVQSIGQMSSHIAHEFNNYLTPVMVYGELLETDDTISPENHELVKGILSSAKEAADLSRKLLDFSRQDSAATLTTINLTAETNAAMDILKRLTPQNITLHVEISDQPVFIRGRKQMTEHLLMNLCNNAFHAMEKDGGSLTVRLQEEFDYALLSVADTGCGISKDAMDKIFEPFYTTKRSGKGTGLGLSVVRNMVTAAGGKIEIDSEQGVGTTFRLYFPLTDASETSSAVIDKKTQSNRKVMVVDDDPEILKSLNAFLKAMHCRPECYNHPATILSKLQDRKDSCDVLITDYSMPSMNGLELAEIVKKLNSDIRIILISGMTDDRFDWYLKNEFIDAFILKSELTKKLAETL